MPANSLNSRGLTLLELMVAMAIFGVICAAMFALLQLSQQRYNNESQLSGSFQEARLGVDQIVRDINVAGYPSPGLFSNPASINSYAVAPFAWAPGYPPNPPNPLCQVEVTCVLTPNSGGPSDFELVIETDLGNGNGVSWIRYLLGGTDGTTLLRGVAPKTAGSTPLAAIPQASMTPFVENVMNNPPGPLLAQIQAQYPAMYPLGAVPIFHYTCATPQGPQPCSTSPTNYNTPKNISDVDVTLIVKTRFADSQTQLLQLMELTGRGHVSNPSY
jgi:prepilin-type N-terminal cleavage/methylation domain-containing protein